MLALAVGREDRVNRRPAAGWARELTIQVPVHDCRRWRDPVAYRTLVQCLHDLTGDTWHVKFVPHKRPLWPGSTPRLAYNGFDVVIPYSGGLDSLATFAHLNATRQFGSPLPISLVHTDLRVRDAVRSDPELARAWMGARVALNAGKHSEPTFRSRGFLFLALATVIARGNGAEAIALPETGQGAIGASLTPIGEEHPSLGTHPVFTHAFSALLERVFDEPPPPFVHPNLWKTKGQLLSELSAAIGDAERVERAILQSPSCSHKVRRKNVKRRECGVCPNCVLRRTALDAAGLEGVAEKQDYVWRDLKALDLASAVSSSVRSENPHFETRPRDWQIARSAVAVHRRVARLADQPESPRMRLEVKRLSLVTGEPADVVDSRLRALLLRHKREWHDFIAHQTKPGSWLARLAE
jgi:7-cyano-7-deazaguanine synthase in queuosine biosynthesis